MTARHTRRTLRVTLRQECASRNLRAAAWEMRAKITVMDGADWPSAAVNTGRTFDLTLDQQCATLHFGTTAWKVRAKKTVVDGADGPVAAIFGARWADDATLGVDRIGEDSC